MTTSPRVSIIMTVFNAGPFLSTAVESILHQTFEDFEFIVVDNASSDGSREFVAELSDPRVRKTLLDFNFGRTAVLNIALNQARGELVANLDADDVAALDRVEKQVAHLDGDQEVVLLGGGYRRIDASGEVLETVVPPSDHVELLNATVAGNPFAHSTVMFRREAAVRVGGYDWRFAYAQDAGLWLRLLRGGKTASLSEVVADLRSHANQFSSRSMLEATETIQLSKIALRNPRLSATARLRGRAFRLRARLVWTRRWLESGFRRTRES